MKIVANCSTRQYDGLYYLAVEVDKIEPSELLNRIIDKELEDREHELPDKLKSSTLTKKTLG